MDARVPSCRAGTSALAGWPCSCLSKVGSCIVSERVQHVALLEHLYLSQRIYGVSTVDIRVDHLGISLMRVAMGLCCGSKFGVWLLKQLPVVPEL
jgi:predicted DNA repair protein MutK